MYKIFADDTLIYDDTIDDYKIDKASLTLEVNKAGSFVFSLYPDHFYYDKFVRLKTIITVYKAGKIVFRGRVLSDVTDYWNNKVLTCEGELSFLQDSIVRPYGSRLSPYYFLRHLLFAHNDAVDDFKQFKLGTVTVEDPNDYLPRSSKTHETTLATITNKLTGSSLGGYLHITHGDDGTDPIPTLHYLADFSKVASQTIDFGANLRNYTKTVKADTIATAIIPLGAEIDDGDNTSENLRLDIFYVNNNKDYIYDEEAVNRYGWIYKTVEWDDITDPNNLLSAARAYLKTVVNQNISIELTAIDLHFIDPTIESFNLGDYIHVVSEPHNFDDTLLCAKQTMDLLKPENDTVTLGHTYSRFSDLNSSVSSLVKSVPFMANSVYNMRSKVNTLDSTSQEVNEQLNYLYDDIEALKARLDALDGGDAT